MLIYIYIYIFHPEVYYKLSFCVIHSTIYASLEEHMPSDVCSIKLRYISLEIIFSLISVLF